MAFPQDEQKQATVNDTAEQALDTAGSNKVPIGSDTVSVPVFVSATARTLSLSRVVDLYINITTAAALAIAIGPTSAAANVLNASESDTLGLIHLHVPVGWYVKITGTVADLAFTAITQ